MQRLTAEREDAGSIAWNLTNTKGLKITENWGNRFSPANRSAFTWPEDEETAVSSSVRDIKTRSIPGTFMLIKYSDT